MSFQLKKSQGYLSSPTREVLAYSYKGALEGKSTLGILFFCETVSKIFRPFLNFPEARRRVRHGVGACREVKHEMIKT
jgi:hypothetical protein